MREATDLRANKKRNRQCEMEQKRKIYIFLPSETKHLLAHTLLDSLSRPRLPRIICRKRQPQLVLSPNSMNFKLRLFTQKKSVIHESSRGRKRKTNFARQRTRRLVKVSTTKSKRKAPQRDETMRLYIHVSSHFLVFAWLYKYFHAGNNNQRGFCSTANVILFVFLFSQLFLSAPALGCESNKFTGEKPKQVEIFPSNIPNYSQCVDGCQPTISMIGFQIFTSNLGAQMHSRCSD
jgi:hypothetical protein